MTDIWQNLLGAAKDMLGELGTARDFESWEASKKRLREAVADIESHAQSREGCEIMHLNDFARVLIPIKSGTVFRDDVFHALHAGTWPGDSEAARRCVNQISIALDERG